MNQLLASIFGFLNALVGLAVILLISGTGFQLIFLEQMGYEISNEPLGYSLKELFNLSQTAWGLILVALGLVLAAVLCGFFAVVIEIERHLRRLSEVRQSNADFHNNSNKSEPSLNPPL